MGTGLQKKILNDLVSEHAQTNLINLTQYLQTNSYNILNQRERTNSHKANGSLTP